MPSRLLRALSPLLLTLFAAFAGSCASDAVFLSYQSVPIDGWDAADAVTFKIDSLPSSAIYRVNVGIRTTTIEAYDFRTLYLEVRQRWEQAGERCDTLSCRLSNERGEVEGDGVNRYQYEFPVNAPFLSAGDRGVISIRHLMRRDILSGFSDIGVLIRR